MGSRLVARVAAVVAVAALAFGTAEVSNAYATTRLTVPGAGPLYYPKPITNLPVGQLYFFNTGEGPSSPVSVLEGYDALNRMIGKNWFPGTTASVVNYPASLGLLSGSLAAPGTNAAVAIGRAALDDQIKALTAQGEPVVVAGLSEGTIVINRELAHLATDPNAPPPGSLSFVLFSSPEFGLAAIYVPLGATVPVFDFTVGELADSQYDVDVVFHQYDAWADPPDRPWRLLAVVNTLFGLLYYHNKPAFSVPADAVEVSKRTSELGGTTTTYMIPSPTLPLLKPLQQLGAPTQLVDRLNSALKPIVDAGYSRLTPDAGPYFSHGRLVRPSENDAEDDADADASEQASSPLRADEGSDVDIEPIAADASKKSSADKRRRKSDTEAATSIATAEREDDPTPMVKPTTVGNLDRDSRGHDSSKPGDDDAQSTSTGDADASDAA